MRKFSMISASEAAVAAIVISGCDSNKKPHSASSNNKVMMGAINDKCPCGAPVDKNAKYTRFEGHDVGFCCSQCQAKWDGMSKADKEAWVAKCMHNTK